MFSMDLKSAEMSLPVRYIISHSMPSLLGGTSADLAKLCRSEWTDSGNGTHITDMVSNAGDVHEVRTLAYSLNGMSASHKLKI